MSRILRTPAGQIVLTVAGLALAQIVLFVVYVVTARHLGPDGFARYQLAISAFVLLAVAAKLGLDEALAYHLPGASGAGARAPRRMIAYALGVALLLSVALGLGARAVAEVIERYALPVPGLRGDLELAWPLLPSLVLLVVGSAALRGLGRSDLRAYVLYYGFGALTLLLLFPLALNGLSSTEAYVVRIAPLAACGTAAVVLVFSRSGPPAPFGAAERARLHGFGFVAVGIAGVQYLTEHGDILLGSHLIAPEELGVYGVAAKVAGLGLLIPGGLAIVVGPAMSAAITGGRSQRAVELHGAASRWLLRAMALLMGLLYALREELFAMFGREYAGSAGLLICLAAGHLAASAFGLNVPMLLARGRERIELAFGAASFAVFAGVGIGLAGTTRAYALALGLAGALVAVNALRLALLARCRSQGLTRGGTLALAGAVAACVAVLVVVESVWRGAGRSWVSAAAFVASGGASLLVPAIRRSALEDLRVLSAR